jgi:hypothetical protein
MQTDKPIDPRAGQDAATRQQENPERKTDSATNKPRVRDWKDALRLVFEGLVTAATITGVWFLVLQWSQTEEALEEARTANRLTAKAQADAASDSIAQQQRYERQLEVATDSAQAAKVQAHTAEIAAKQSLKSFRRDQRAWVAYGAVVLNQEPATDGETIKVTLLIQNVGKTPAFETKVRSRLHVGSNPLDPPLWSTILAENPTTIFPGLTNLTTSFDTAGLPLPLRVITAYRDGTAKFYVWAYVLYRDAFGVEHWTQACKYHVLGMALNAFSDCDYGNETDKQEN